MIVHLQAMATKSEYEFELEKLKKEGRISSGARRKRGPNQAARKMPLPFRGTPGCNDAS